MDIQFSQNHINTFKKMGIQTVYLFGSQALGKAGLLSDVDIGVIFIEPAKYKDKTLEVYCKLYDILTDVLPEDYLRRRFQMREHEVDIVFLQFGPISLQFDAINKSKVLYEVDREKTLNYEEYVSKMHCDFKYIYDVSHKALLERYEISRNKTR